MKFDSVNPSRTSLGKRLNQIYMNGDLKGYIRAGWEQVAGAEAGGHSSFGALSGNRRPDLGGSSIFGEAGLIIQPVGSSYAVDIGAIGLGGQAQGASGSAGLKFEL